MTAFTIEVRDADVRAALAKLTERISNPTPMLRLMAEQIMERTKERFASSTGPDGQRWKPNARSTIESYVAAGGGFGRRGINAKGRKLAGSKKPLIGHSGDLRRQFHIVVSGTGVVVKNTMSYAAIQQFGGHAGRGRRVKIPARPFLPVRLDGSLYPQEQAKILDLLNGYLMAF